MTDRDTSYIPTRKPWAITFTSIVIAAGVASLPFLLGQPRAEQMPDIVRFIGHFHPLVLHLPIGVFTLVVFQELCLIFSKRDDKRQRNPLFPLFFGATSAIVAVIAGLMLYHGHADDYGRNPIAERHLWGGLAFAIAAIFTFILKTWTLALDWSPSYYRVLLFTSVGVMGFTSHDGASMTHGSDYLTIYAPEPIRKMMGLPLKKEKSLAPLTGEGSKTNITNSADPIVYAEIIAPILERRCVQCHKESKSKGDFRMDRYDLLVKGGKETAGLEAGNSSKSNIIVRIELPPDDEDHMPPEGKSDIEPSEILLLKWWIDSGADSEKKLSEYVLPLPVKEAISSQQLAPSPK